MNKQVIALVLLASTLVGILVLKESQVEKTLQQTFDEWKLKFSFGADLTQSELLYRIKVFEANLLEINQHNSKLGKTYELGLNQFSALTKEEFAATYLTKIQANSNYVQVQVPQVTGPSIDWVSWGAVSPVKYQGNCVASYAFSAVGAIEGISAIFFRTQQEYSVQQVVDCSSSYGNNGCYNGRMDNTFNYVKAVGINTWSSYPYVGGLQQCRVSSGLFKVSGYTTVSDCNNLATALTVRPVSVAVDGNNMQSYTGGIFWNCGTNLSLPLLLVGMTDSYWTLKNSMGTTWGQKGYIRLQRGNTCGVCMAAVYPNP